MTGQIDQRIANMTENVALPRQNGELIFTAPWEARAFGLAVALNEQGTYAWGEFSRSLAREIAAAEAVASTTSYYERWLATLENLIFSQGLLSPAEYEAMIQAQAFHDAHEHGHEHHHHNGEHHHDHC